MLGAFLLVAELESEREEHEARLADNPIAFDVSEPTSGPWHPAALVEQALGPTDSRNHEQNVPIPGCRAPEKPRTRLHMDWTNANARYHEGSCSEIVMSHMMLITFTFNL